MKYFNNREILDQHDAILKDMYHKISVWYLDITYFTFPQPSQADLLHKI